MWDVNHWWWEYVEMSWASPTQVQGYAEIVQSLLPRKDDEEMVASVLLLLQINLQLEKKQLGDLSILWDIIHASLHTHTHSAQWNVRDTKGVPTHTRHHETFWTHKLQ